MPTPQQPPEAEERAFLDAYDPSAFPRPSVATDVVVLTLRDAALHVALYPRDEHPHKGRWALPGGFVHLDEGLDAAARRLLRTKLGLEGVFLEQLYTFGEPGRDPRMRVITVAYLALVPPGLLDASLGALARVQAPPPGQPEGPAAALDPEGAPLPLAFDHAEILRVAVQRLRGKLTWAPVDRALLPPTFTLRQLQDVHEAILGEPLLKPAFRRRMLASGQLVATGALEAEVRHRPAELYAFTPPEPP